MKQLFKKNTSLDDKNMFGLCVNSVSGCVVKVGDKIFRAKRGFDSNIEFEEIVPEFEMTEEEFKEISDANN